MPPYGFGDGKAGARVFVYAVKPLNHNEESIEKGSGNKFFVYGVVRPPRQFEALSAIIFNLRHRSD